ncbi:RPA-related protein RADX isoform X3 [Xiphophorus hellerii]|uniref:RPA-related protein RADX isoform X3 n=1 Tax=Xiphophorus hellerii TaxID=8084 RepID=UPI0013B3F9FE|nr:RPA-related protein RADX isoform X3 [Xiphophorus hellerii]
MESSSCCSSMAAGLPQESFLQRTLERLPSTQSLKLTAEEAAPVAVVAVQRYLSEPTEGQQLDSYSYDVTITDGVWRAKCFLHPSLNHLVHRNTLRTGTDVSVRQCSFVYNERRLGHGYICVEKVEGSAETSTLLPRINNPSSLPMLVKHGMERSAVLQSDVPLQVSRKHYLSLWNNDDPEGDMWISGSASPDPVLDVSKVTLLSSLESSFRVSWKPLPLLVKIIHKSRLRYYGKFGLKIDYPYQTYFEVADQSGTMSLVLWNELCPEYYLRMNVGAVLYLQNYTLKQSYSNRSRPQMDHHRMKHFTSIEICLNPRNPAADITVVSPKSVLPQWGLPEVSYQFTTRSELEKISNGSACDVIGLVTFVGRVERVRSKGSKAPEKYWTYRWVHSVDGTSDRPFILELFSSSQPEIFNQICPMTYLVCTQMRVCQAEGSLPYLTSSCETEIFITGYHKGQPYVSDPRVKSFIQWTKTLKDNVVLQKTAVGGHYCYPPPPRRFSQSATYTSGQVPLVAVSDLKRELESLQYREHKKLAIQGEITAIRYTNYPKKVSNEPKNYSSDTHKDPADCLMSPSSDRSKANTRKRTNQFSFFAPRRLKYKNTKEGEEQEEEESASAYEEVQHEQQECQDSAAPSWESSSWSKQREEISEHLHHGGLHQDSVSRRFTFDEKSTLLRWSNLQPTRWTPQAAADAPPHTPCPGHYQLTILGINKQIAVDAAFLPVVRSDDPRAVGLSRDPHDNSMLSCLSSGFLCPLDSTAGDGELTPWESEEIVATARGLENTHVVCVLELCQLGGDKVEILIDKVYKVMDVTLD